VPATRLMAIRRRPAAKAKSQEQNLSQRKARRRIVGAATGPAAELFRQSLKLHLVHVPLSGGGAAVVSVLAGHTPVFISTPPVIQHIKEGTLLGAGGDEQSTVADPARRTHDGGSRLSGYRGRGVVRHPGPCRNAQRTSGSSWQHSALSRSPRLLRRHLPRESEPTARSGAT
jgi:hypothetical protein